MHPGEAMQPSLPQFEAKRAAQRRFRSVNLPRPRQVSRRGARAARPRCHAPGVRSDAVTAICRHQRFRQPRGRADQPLQSGQACPWNGREPNQARASGRDPPALPERERRREQAPQPLQVPGQGGNNPFSSLCSPQNAANCTARRMRTSTEQEKPTARDGGRHRRTRNRA
jgi:hypothetical protein